MFTLEERQIYSYTLGDKTVYVDPIALKRKLIRLAGGDLAGLAQAASPNFVPDADGKMVLAPEEPPQTEQRLAAEERLLEVIRTGFDLPPISAETGVGVTEAMTWKIWDSFNEWLEKNERRVES